MILRFFLSTVVPFSCIRISVDGPAFLSELCQWQSFQCINASNILPIPDPLLYLQELASCFMLVG